jgi:DNA-binding transcriptional ArsR family regulator
LWFAGTIGARELERIGPPMGSAARRGTFRSNAISCFPEVTPGLVATAPFRLSARPSAPELVAKYFRGLGDPTRLRILELLGEAGELPVGELVERLGLPQATVSTHLGCLRWCGFVSTRRERRSVLYRVADERVRTLVALGHELLADNAEHVAVCRTIDAGEA